jgi:hypothetical protein
MSTQDRPKTVGEQEPNQRGSATEGVEEPAEQLAEESADESVASPSELSLDVIFEILKNRRRRDVINYPREEADRSLLRESLAHLAVIEHDTTP